jgi:hypothetical protein
MSTLTLYITKYCRPFCGDVDIDDPQRSLFLERPRLPGGGSPPGFVDFAVNLIHLDQAHLNCLTASGHGLRETCSTVCFLIYKFIRPEQTFNMLFL